MRGRVSGRRTDSAAPGAWAGPDGFGCAKLRDAASTAGGRGTARRLTRLTSLRYDIALRWQGSTGAGWERYDRGHLATAPPAEQEIRLTTGESKGDPALLNPEQLVVMAASSCQMLWFLHLAAKARVDVLEYADDATATMPPEAGLEEIVLRPRIVVADAAQRERAEQLMHKAHTCCNVAKTLRTPIAIEPHVEVRA